MRNDASKAELSLTIVRDHGLVSNWQLNVIAADTYRYGRPEPAAAILMDFCSLPAACNVVPLNTSRDPE